MVDANSRRRIAKLQRMDLGTDTSLIEALEKAPATAFTRGSVTAQKKPGFLRSKWSDKVKIGTSQGPFRKSQVISRYEDIGLMFDEMTSRKLGLGDDEDARWRSVRPSGMAFLALLVCSNVWMIGEILTM